MATNEIGGNAQIVLDVQQRQDVGRQRIDRPMKEEDYGKWLMNPVKIWHQDWTSTSVYSNVTDDLFGLWRTSAPTQLIDKYSNLLYCKADIRVRVVVQGSPYSAGMGILSFTPTPFSGMVGGGTSYPAEIQELWHNCRIVPHIVLDPSQNKTYELVLPITTVEGFYTFNINLLTGSYLMEFFPFVQLISGTATAPTAKICVYASLENVQFEGKTVALSSELLEENKPDGLLSSTVKNGSKLAMSLGAFFPQISPELTLFSTVTSTIGDVLKFFGFSKPVVTENTHMLLNRTCDNYSQSDGRSTALVLGRSQVQSLGINPAYANGEFSDMDFTHILKIPSLLFRNSGISAAVAAENPIAGVGVDPTFTSDVTWPTPMAGVALCHQYWAGDITFRFEFIASVFHRATLLIAWDPWWTSTSFPTFAEALTALQNTTVTISGNTVVDFVVPYKQFRQMLLVREKLFVDTTPPVRGTSNGTVFLYMVNPITSNGSTDGIKFNLYQYSDNMVFAGPTPRKIADFTYKTVALCADWVQPIRAEMGPKTDLSLLPLRMIDDMPRTVKDLTSRLVKFTTSTLTLSDTNHSFTLKMPNAPAYKVDAFPGSFTVPHMTYAGWFAPAYLGYRGGMKVTYHLHKKLDTYAERTYKMIPYHQLANGPAFTVEFGLDEAQHAYAWTQPNLDVTSRADVNYPAGYVGDFYAPRFQWTTFRDRMCVEVTFEEKTGDTAAAPTWILNSAAGTADDGVYTMFLGFPRVVQI